MDAIGVIKDPSDILAAALMGECQGATDLRWRADVSSSTLNLIDQNLALADKTGLFGKLADATGVVFFAIKAGTKLSECSASVVQGPSDLIGAVMDAAAKRGLSVDDLCKATGVSPHDLERLRTLLYGASALARLADCAKVEFIAVSAEDADSVRTLRDDLNSVHRRPGSRLPMFA